MKKEIYIIILIIIIILGAILFTNNKKEITIDINKLADDITQNTQFTDELIKIDDETITKLYNINNANSQVVYISSGATAEEIAIFDFENEDECKIALEKAKQRIENQKNSFKNYMPKEMEKLENAIIENKNHYLIVCVTDNQEGVEEILKKYTK